MFLSEISRSTPWLYWTGVTPNISMDCCNLHDQVESCKSSVTQIDLYLHCDIISDYHPVMCTKTHRTHHNALYSIMLWVTINIFVAKSQSSKKRILKIIHEMGVINGKTSCKIYEMFSKNKLLSWAKVVLHHTALTTLPQRTSRFIQFNGCKPNCVKWKNPKGNTMISGFSKVMIAWWKISECLSQGLITQNVFTNQSLKIWSTCMT